MASLNIIEKTKDLNLSYVLLMSIAEKFGLTKKKKDNDNVFDAFKPFIKELKLKKYKLMTLMPDHDSTFTISKFEELLEENEIFQTINIKDDYHALGLIACFSGTSKKILTRIFLRMEI